MRATFRKRYITLAPVAGVVGVGIDLKDPDNLLGGNGAEVSHPAILTRSPPHRATSCFEFTSSSLRTGAQGFTVALLERGHEGLRMGPRHMPLNAAFMNGTVEGDDVWIPMDSILGGQVIRATYSLYGRACVRRTDRMTPTHSTAAASAGTCS